MEVEALHATAPASRRRAPPAERRAQILDAAMRCFGDRGYYVATMDDLARAARLSKGSLYWHFRSKEEVLLALFDRFADEVLGVFAEVEASEAPVVAGLEHLGAATLERLDAALPMTRAWLEFFAHPEARQRMAQVYGEVRARLARVLARAVEHGELAALSPESVAAGLVASIEGLLIQAFVDPTFDARGLWRDYFATLVRGLGSPPPRVTA